MGSTQSPLLTIRQSRRLLWVSTSTPRLTRAPSSMAVLFDLLRLTTGITARLVCIAMAKACLPRVPPHNWTRGFPSIKTALQSRSLYQAVSPPRVANEKRCKRCSQTLKAPLFNSEGYIDVERFLKEDIPMVTLGDPFDDSAIKVQPKLDSDDGDMTLVAIDSPLVDFSIYSNVSSPNLNKAMLISPTRPTMPDVRDVDLTQLKAASDRVSEILRENRRRLDAGEDSNTTRKEARRKRAQELSAARKARGGF
ncbi:hypothetical protein GALMADRAFT_240088 [Galerina marginata CBS 339.88]|uniref:Uncharacterized protein n=1 Tax=Galerina marginata (strain CBS 339.88) TaxID=685588 RepID=A0A067TPK2_GALM3|nr:hypothetical protein GALMADRAFT_240088 [Galerina marginata CBS 339.88]